MLHVLNGDATREKLERSSVEGRLAVWADTLHDGPVPGLLSDEDLVMLRGRYLAAQTGEAEDRFIATGRMWNAGLAAYRDFDEVVFWLEHDLFDQLILIRHLHWISRIEPGATRFSLICIGSFPGVTHFTGLGPLAPEQLASLLPKRTAVTPVQIALGQEAWDLYRATDPMPLAGWIRRDLPALPFLPGALRRHFEDYPSVSDGLSRSERQILTAVRQGSNSFGKIFAACARMEERVYMGDTTFWGILRTLAGGRNPLVELQGSASPHFDATRRVRLNDLGEVVLDGGADYVELNGIDRWMGGVHLSPSQLWRWNPATETLVREDS